VKTADEAVAFVREHGIVLVSAKGAAPKLTEAILGAPIKGSWWSHPRSREIFAVLNAVCESDEVLVCRLVDGKVTLVHRRLWPALVRVAKRFDPAQIAQVKQEHTAGGRHVNTEVPFPEWVPAAVAAEAKLLGERAALEQLAAWLPKESASP
jgi:hypothetical protein